MKRAWHQNAKRSPASERTDALGNVFHSKSELRRWKELKLLEQIGEISVLERQKEFPLEINGRPVLIRSAGFPKGRPAKYTADFIYFQNGKRVVEEHKGGVDDRESRLRRAIVEAIYRIEIIVTGPAKTPRKSVKAALPYNPEEDSRESYNEAVRACGEQYKAGAPIGEFFLPERRDV